MSVNERMYEHKAECADTVLPVSPVINNYVLSPYSTQRNRSENIQS